MERRRLPNDRHPCGCCCKANLTPKERTVVTLRFGLDGTNEWRTLAEVARHMNCSREYCRQVVQRALRKLRKTGIQSGLVESAL